MGLAPIDYTIRASDPAQSAMGGFQMGIDRRQQELAAMQGTERHQLGMEQTAQNMAMQQAQEDRAAQAFAMQQQEAAAEREKQIAMQQEQSVLVEKVRDGTVTSADFAEFSIKYPDISGGIKDAMDGLGEERKKTEVFEMTRVASALKAGKPEYAVEILEERAAAADNAGLKEEARMLRAAVAGIKMDPEAGLTTVGMLLHNVDEDAFKAVFGDAADSRVQSSESLPGGYTKVVYRDGTVEFKDATGRKLSPEEAAAAPELASAFKAADKAAEAGAVEQTKADIEVATVGDIKSEEEAAKVNQASVADASARLATISSTLNNYDQALAALDAGANTGVLAQRFPTITQAGALLDNAKLRAGLDVIASVTFGALSEGERNAAMQTAMPTNLDPPELRKWIQNRKAAELKIAQINKDAVTHFSQQGKSQRELRNEWIKKYAQTIPGMDEAPAQPTAAGGSGSPKLSEKALSYLGGANP